ncbi:MAG TPA: hypothetical protein VHZ95_18990 [Polyangiales bacterium]|nr:hypothetical protein [Polyangiales bacterium]
MSRLSSRFTHWLIAMALMAAALYPRIDRALTALQAKRRLDRIEAAIARGAVNLPIDPMLSVRVQRLGPLLASWETVGGCGAGSTAGAGTVKWIGRGTTGGLFTDLTQANYIHLHDAQNYVISTQLSRDINEQWTVGVFVPFVFKRYDNYLVLPGASYDISNGGIGDINALGTFRFGPINENALTLSIGVPTGSYDARYKTILLTQEKQLGIGRVTGSLTLDHTIDETWGIVVLGGIASWRGGQNSLGNYRSPNASLYAYAGYFLGPFVPAIGVTVSGFTKPDRDEGIDQDVPLVLAAANASIEWSTDWIAVLLGVSLPVGLYAKPDQTGGIKSQQSSTGIQPWTAALGVSISPF